MLRERVGIVLVGNGVLIKVFEVDFEIIKVCFDNIYLVITFKYIGGGKMLVIRVFSLVIWYIISI